MATTLTPAAAARKFVRDFVTNDSLDTEVKNSVLDVLGTAKASAATLHLKAGIENSTDRFNNAREYNKATPTPAIDAEAAAIRKTFKAALPYMEGKQAELIKAFLDPKSDVGLTAIIADVKVRIKAIDAPKPSGTY